ncbi:hypothetical protein KBY83_08155 [Cyanobium sp. WKJ7-Wakatipu]|uniref:hypothetical protein n=1 Tax=Cyanobium sp. WKJ7-Wakatipu TaxID=2823726 RepID=UPI0020CF1FB4|nr:hypothetical protein [Cyanobium sp. WKJ7-Wakatipu]MCP9783293.1 hypothetical protein [Cyanobium sp. WKJ7-Wakatipu]
MAIWKRCILLGLLLILGQLLVTWAIELPSAPVLVPDSGFYLDGAKRFPLLLPQQRTYLGMILYLRLCSFLGPAAWLAVVGNAAAVWLASLALWQIAARWAGPRAGWIAAGIWLLNPLTAQWTRYVLTEPLFYSAVIGWLWLALFRPGWPLLIFSGIAGSLRPNAFTLLAAAITWIFALRVRPGSRAVLLIALGWTGLLAALVLVAPLVSPVAMKVPQLIAQGTVIHSHPELDVSMASGPLAILRLMALRIAWELGQWRPWYSLRFNLFIVVSMFAFYAVSLRGAWLTRGSRLFWAVVLVSLPSMAVIAATWAIHEGRFGWWFLVAWIPWAAIGCQQQNRLALR